MPTIITEDGYMGLALPNARKGDTVAVQLDGDVPMVLRKCDKSSEVVC